MNAVERTLLRLLAGKQKEWTAPDLVHGSDGRLKHGTVHVHLSRLIEMRLVGARDEPDNIGEHGGFPRRFYWITENGLAVLQSPETDFSSVNVLGRFVILVLVLIGFAIYFGFAPNN